MAKQKYFASEESDDKVNYLKSKSEDWYRNIQLNGYLEKLQSSWQAYHGVFFDEASHKISYGGENGELVNLSINHYRNLATHILVMITSTRPSFQCRAVNTDRKSLLQAKLGNGLLDYYMREKRLERYLKKATEYAIVLGSGYIKMGWNATQGEIYDYIEPDLSDVSEVDENGVMYDSNGNVVERMPIYEGDVGFSVLSPYDVVYDPTKEDSEYHDWVITRTFLNRFDLAKKYPEMEEKILSNPTKDSTNNSRRFSLTPFDETSDIAVYEFFHKRTESMPNGNYMVYLENGTVLEDDHLPYRDLPVYRISPADILGTPFGYTGMFDLLPMQEMVNSLYSTTATNINAFGVQNILNPQGNNVKVNQFGSGLNFIEYNAQAGKPEALQLTSTPKEVFELINMLERAMETISGVNAVARGNPTNNLQSGSALALVQSQALQFASGLQQSYVQLLEDVGTGLINLLKDFASVPRIAAIAGISNASRMISFKSEDIKDINRVVVDVGNALVATTAGRMQIAENLLQMGAITDPAKYLEVLNTGNLDAITQGIYNELDTIRFENEELIKGEIKVVAFSIDKHSQHIREHRDVIADPMLRQDAELVQRVTDHIMEHIELSRTTSPDLLVMIGEQPLAPAGGSPVAPGTVAPEQVPQNMESTGDMSQAPETQNLAPMQQDGAPNLPNVPRPAGEDVLGPQPTSPADLLAKNV
jgi:hypothetical protein